jgi:RNA polymerase primary sigma factor/RNA polymerase nonessential primary-like sigma factor
MNIDRPGVTVAYSDGVRGAAAGAPNAAGTDATTDFRDRNDELFRRRRELQCRLASLVGDDGEPADARAAARVRRLLDDVTSEIVTFNLGLVRSYCRRFTSGSSRDDSADFEAAGLLGLMRAIDSFDPEQGRFGHWAFKPIQREVLRAVRNADHPNVNLGDFERRPEILRAFRQLQGEDESYVPTHAEVAAAVGATVDQVRRVLAPPRFESVSRPVGGDDSVTVGDTVESDQPGPESVVVSSMTLAALKKYGLAVLDHRELYVLVRRFGLDGEPEERLSDIGRTLGLSREAIRQIEAKAIAKMQHPMVLRRIHRHGRR